MAETLLPFKVYKLWEVLVKESDLVRGVDVTELASDLNFLISILNDADAKKHTHTLVRNCVEEITEIIFDAEDIIQTFLLKEELSKTSRIKKGMRRLFFIIVHKELASDIRGISTRISKVIGDKQTFGVQQMIVGDSKYLHHLQESYREMPKEFHSNSENDIVGLEQNVKILVGYLVEEDDIQVVSITGMCGIGKTTLAQQVFNHEIVKNHFDGVVWVFLSQEFTRKHVWQTILQKLSLRYDEKKVSNMTEEEIKDKLFQLLETSKSLIIFDDIWKEDDWDIIKNVFPSKKGWKVLLTSRNEGVGLYADPTCVTLKPQFLTIQESLTLFQMIAFPRNIAYYKVDVEMAEMGKKMIKHCQGLPLAVKMLGGLLAAKYSIDEWKQVYENIESCIRGGTSFNDRNFSLVYHIMCLSFEYLPMHLKHCFLYLAHFLKDHSIDIENLSYYLAAEGIPRPRCYDGATIREVADEYIEELVKRNMVISQRSMLTSRFETCQLHEMMRVVCLRKAKEENFVDIVDATNSPCKSRRIALHQVDESSHPKEMMKNPKLRSFLFIKGTTAWMASSLDFTRLQLLRVLDLSFTKFKGGKLPSSIGKLIHLRYLSLYMAHVTQLPSSMRNLKLLLYLDLCLYVSSPIYIPNFLKEMRELAYLSLPLRIHDKVKLELGNLVNLERVNNFSTKHISVGDLHRMTRLKRLSILFNGECYMETLSLSLSELKDLENLTIHGYTNDEEGFFLDWAHHLKQLDLMIYLPKLPDVQHFPSNLTTLSLCNCRLEEDPMPILEKLRQLRVVSLRSQSFVGKRIVCVSSGFPQLQKLQLEKLEELEDWIVEEGSMPLLHTLSIFDCYKLEELPDGLRFITSLKELVILGASLEFKEKCSRGGYDFYKIRHIPLVQIN